MVSGNRKIFVDLFALDEHDDSVSCLADFIGVRSLHLDQDSVRCAVEAHRDRQAQCRRLLFENAVQSGTQFESKFWPNEVDNVSRQCAARWLQKTPGIVRQVDHMVSFVDNNAWRSQFFESAA